MDFLTIFNETFVVVVMVACLVVGYIIKTSLSFIPNKYIPTILAVFGAAINAAVSGVSIDSVVYGALMGLASTGFYEMFRNFVEGRKGDE
jgi:prepilin signal peptidase PulO-like enzyme (type II secretory pathway)